MPHRFWKQGLWEVLGLKRSHDRAVCENALREGSAQRQSNWCQKREVEKLAIVKERKQEREEAITIVWCRGTEIPSLCPCAVRRRGIWLLWVRIGAVKCCRPPGRSRTGKAYEGCEEHTFMERRSLAAGEWRLKWKTERPIHRGEMHSIVVKHSKMNSNPCLNKGPMENACRRGRKSWPGSWV